MFNVSALLNQGARATSSASRCSRPRPPVMLLLLLLLAVNRTLTYNNLWSTAARAEITFSESRIRSRSSAVLVRQLVLLSFQTLFCAISPSAFETVGAFEAQHKDESKGYSNRAEGLPRKPPGDRAHLQLP